MGRPHHQEIELFRFHLHQDVELVIPHVDEALGMFTQIDAI